MTNTNRTRTLLASAAVIAAAVFTAPVAQADPTPASPAPSTAPSGEGCGQYVERISFGGVIVEGIGEGPQRALTDAWHKAKKAGAATNDWKVLSTSCRDAPTQRA